MHWLDRNPFANLFLHRVFFKTACAVLLPACALFVAGVQAVQHASPDAATQTASVEWPREWNGQPLRPLALTEVEERFARQFPGALARLTDGRQVLVMRQVRQPTRMLHPAADCYQGIGYRIQAQQLEQDANKDLWRCFEAVRGDSRQRVCERIEDASGQAWTDTSAWYWAAVMGKTQGPWQAVTVATPITGVL